LAGPGEVDALAKRLKAYAAFLSKIPMGRFCKPEEVAAMIAFLLGDDLFFTTGSVFDLIRNSPDRFSLPTIATQRGPGKGKPELSDFLKNNINHQPAWQEIVDFSYQASWPPTGRIRRSL